MAYNYFADLNFIGKNPELHGILQYKFLINLHTSL